MKAEALDAVDCVLGVGSAGVPALAAGATSAPMTVFVRPQSGNGCAFDAGTGGIDAGDTDAGAADADEAEAAGRRHRPHRGRRRRRPPGIDADDDAGVDAADDRGTD